MATLAVAVSVAVPVAHAGGGREQIRFDAADQAAARTAVLKRSQLGPGTWQGGVRKPDLSPAPACAGYHPKQSDLVLTGAAETDWRRPGIELDSEAQVLKTARMVRLDWQRSITPAATRCLRSSAQRSLGAAGRVISFKRMAIPRLGTYSAAYRLTALVHGGGASASVTVEAIVFGQGRRELTLTSTAPTPAQPAVAAADLRLARLMIHPPKA